MADKKTNPTVTLLFQVTSVRGPEVVLTAINNPDQDEGSSIAIDGPPSARLVLAVANTALLSSLGLGTVHALELRPAAKPEA